MFAHIFVYMAHCPVTERLKECVFGGSDLLTLSHFLFKTPKEINHNNNNPA